MHAVSSSTQRKLVTYGPRQGNWLLMDYASHAARLHELFDKKYSLFASVKTGSEIIENCFLSGGEQRKRSITALKWISLLNFCKLTSHLSSSQACKNSSDKHSIFFWHFFHQFRKFDATRASKPFSNIKVKESFSCHVIFPSAKNLDVHIWNFAF